MSFQGEERKKENENRKPKGVKVLTSKKVRIDKKKRKKERQIDDY